MAADIVVVLVTTPSEEVAEHIARTLVSERLAACVNVSPGLRSIFRWEGRVQEEREVLLVIKTGADRLRDVEARLRALHPYTVPEILALPVAAGHEPYLAWVADSVTVKGGDDADQE